MENESLTHDEEEIREEMNETRSALTEKIQTLEQQVASTVEGTTTGVAQTVEAVTDSVKETVEVVKETVQETISTVKEGIQETIDTVKGTFEEGVSVVQGILDVPALVRNHPWPMFGGAVAAGFCLERFVLGSGSSSRSVEEGWHGNRMPADGAAHENRFASAPAASSRLAGIFSALEPEISRLKALALGALLNQVRDKVASLVPSHMASSVTEIVDDFTRKLGGQVLSPSNDSGKAQRG